MQINMCSITDEAQTSAECPHMSSVSNASIILRVSCWCVSEWATDCLKNLYNFALFCFCSCSYDAFEIVWVLFFRWSLIICQSQVSVLDRLQARLQGKWFVGRKGAIYLCYLAHKCSAVVFPTERCCAGVGWRMIQTRFSHSFMFAFLRCSVSHWVLSFREEWLRLYNGHSQTPTIRGCRNVCENENKVLYQRYSRHLQTNESSKNIRTIAYAQLHKHQPPSTHSHTHIHRTPISTSGLIVKTYRRRCQGSRLGDFVYRKCREPAKIRQWVKYSECDAPSADLFVFLPVPIVASRRGDFEML